MFSRAVTFSAVVAALTFGGSGIVAQASSGPPPPTATNGHTVQLVASGLKTPTSFAFGDGAVFEGDGGNSEGSAPPNGGVYLLKDGKATQIPGSPQFVAGLAWHRGALYVSGGAVTAKGVAWQLDKWTGWTGKKFTTQKTIYTARSKRFDGFNGLGFGANGRLYVGVDVGLTDGNDHGPASTSPHVYQILSFTPNGAHHKIFASGIRQPWQFTFPAGSNSPYVTDLGQDSGANNPPDFILRVKAGQDYGFPTCNQTSAKACKGDAKPFRKFGPHTDLMGIGLHSSRLYLTSFQGPNGKGPGGEVFSMSLNGKTLKPLITGFVAPTVGLGIHRDYLYVGELTGQVFRLKL
jgi:glucose/arabinose dehydrogenase